MKNITERELNRILARRDVELINQFKADLAKRRKCMAPYTEAFIELEGIKRDVNKIEDVMTDWKYQGGQMNVNKIYQLLDLIEHRVENNRILIERLDADIYDAAFNTEI